jgi:hypothetical protein
LYGKAGLKLLQQVLFLMSPSPLTEVVFVALDFEGWRQHIKQIGAVILDARDIFFPEKWQALAVRQITSTGFMRNYKFLFTLTTYAPPGELATFLPKNLHRRFRRASKYQ